MFDLHGMELLVEYARLHPRVDITIYLTWTNPKDCEFPIGTILQLLYLICREQHLFLPK
jgi:hypothetical protein